MANHSSRVLVTGAGGFTGSALSEHLQEHGHTPVPLRQDIRDLGTLREFVQEVRPTHVVHLAAISFVAHENVDEIYETNVLGTRHLLEVLSLLQEKPRRVILASSANVYGAAEQLPISEGSLLAPLNDYAVSKVAMEYMARLYATRLPLIILRPFNYTGPGQDIRFLVPKIVDHFKRRAPAIQLGNLDVARDYSDVRDIVRVYRHLLDLEVESGTTFNFCSGESIQLREIVRILELETGHKINIEVNPELVRSGEIPCLVGSRKRLSEAMMYEPEYVFRQTLRAMLTA